MKDIFFGIAVLAIPLAIVGWLIYLYGHFFWTLFTDWRFRKELNAIRSHVQEQKQRRHDDSITRLDNGCEHRFGTGLGGFPVGVCTKCGLSESRPSGPCDHVWRRGEGNMPFSFCEKCGKKYSVLESGKR